MSVAQKILRTGVFSFLAALLPGLANALIEFSKTGDWSVLRTVVVSLIIGACGMAVRAVIAYLPILPDDNVGWTR